jgi:hypothetical protein
LTLANVIGSHAYSLEASMRVTNSIPLGSPFFLPVDAVNLVETLQWQWEKAGCYVNAQVEEVKCRAPDAGKVWTGGAWAARCAFSDRNLHSMMPLDRTHVRLKRTHACDQ